MRKVRGTVAVLGLVAALSGVGVPPASATTDTFTGTLSYSCYGCGTVLGSTASFTLGSGAAVTATFTADNAAGPACGLGGRVEGTFAGAISGDFTWEQIPGNTIVVSGAASGVGTFVVVEPVTVNPCGAPMRATIVGELTY